MIQDGEFVRALRAAIPSAAVFSGLDPRVSFHPWSLSLAEWPLARVECCHTDQVSAALRVANKYKVPVTVCGGRQDVWGRNSRNGALVLDLSEMRSIIPDLSSDRVEIQSGVTTGRLLDSLPSDIVIPTTVNRNVGVIGAALGGGYGLLCGSYGLTCDALVSAELVLTDGEVLRANERENVEVLLALRGGGSGYGVVTSARFRTEKCKQVFAATVVAPLEASTSALLLTQELLDEHPIELGILPLFVKAPDGKVQLTLSIIWNGPAPAGERVLSNYKLLKGLTVRSEGTVPFRQTLDEGELWPRGRFWSSTTLNLRYLSHEVIEALVEICSRMPLPGNILLLHDFHGNALDLPNAGSSFRLREEHYVACAVGSWDERDHADVADQHRAWIEDVGLHLRPLALQGGYVNFLHPAEGQRVKAAYGDSAGLLQSLKERLDPSDLLRHATGRIL